MGQYNSLSNYGKTQQNKNFEHNPWVVEYVWPAEYITPLLLSNKLSESSVHWAYFKQPTSLKTIDKETHIIIQNEIYGQSIPV